MVAEVDVQCGLLQFALLLRSSLAKSRSYAVPCVCDLHKEIATFLRQKNLPYNDQFFDPRWLARLALMADITTHLNPINEGKYILVADMRAHITAFEVKLRLCEAHSAL